MDISWKEISSVKLLKVAKMWVYNKNITKVLKNQDAMSET
jgi:hypothetical protein